MKTKHNIYVHKHTPITSPLLSSTFSSPTLFPSSFSPRFRSPFPSYHASVHPLSFYHPHLLSFPPCFRPFPPLLLPHSPFSILLPLLLFLSLPLPFGPYHSPSSLNLLSPSSLEILHPLLPPFLLSSNLCTLFPTSLPLSLFNISYVFRGRRGLSLKTSPPAIFAKRRVLFPLYHPGTKYGGQILITIHRNITLSLDA